LDEPLAKHVIEEFAKERALCQRVGRYGFGRCLVILDVNFMVKLAMRSMFLASFLRTHRKSPGMPWDDFAIVRSSVGRLIMLEQTWEQLVLTAHKAAISR